MGMINIVIHQIPPTPLEEPLMSSFYSTLGNYVLPRLVFLLNIRFKITI